MSPRKKNTGKSGPFNQSTINTFFSAKSKHASASTRPKRLAQSSLTARPLRSKRSPDPEEILDLTHSTSPVREPESPPSAKKRKLRATSPDQSPISGAEEDSSPMSRSTSPALQNTTKPGPSTNVQPMSVSPAPSQTGRSHTMLDIDPDEVVESSQTQYLNVWFTPSSQRTFHMDLGRVPAPVFAPVSTRTSQEGQEPSPARETPGPSNPTEESQPTAFIPSSQGEVSEPYTPKKRNRTWLDQSGTDTQVPSGAMPPSAQEPNIIDRLAGTPKRQRPANGIPGPAHAVWASTPINNRVGPVNPFTPRFSSPQPIPSPMYPSGRSDMIPSSQGEPSLEATEIGTVESPPKTGKYPADAIVPTFRVPPPAPIVQDTLHTRPRATTPLMPISNININAPRTPQRAVEQVPSSPSEFPSPGRLMSSLGFEGPRSTKNVPLPDEGPTLSEVNGVEKCTRPHALSAPPCPEDGADDRVPKATHSQVHGEDSPARSQSSSQTVVPSSQPIHDSSPPPDYDLDPQRHAFNQGRLQSFNQPPVPVQPPAGFDSRFPSNSSRPYFTAQTHQSPSSSQSLPPSQSPIKGGRFDPNLSAAGVRGVFGMLGFGSEADSHEPQTGQRQGNNNGGNDSHTPVAYDLPPSSPPPQTPTRHESRESSPDSYLVPATGRKGKAKSRKGKTPIRDSPLVRAFEDAKKRSKATPSVRRPASKITHSSPIPSPHPDDMEVDSSPVRDSKPRSKRPTPKTGAQSPSSRRASLAKAPVRAQRQKSVDQDIVESSDAEEMEIDVQLPPTLPTSTRATAGAHNSAETTKSSSTITPGRNRTSMRVSVERVHAPATPAQEERLPSSVSPSPIRVRRYSSPPPENTQTQDEAETPWESLRPSQSVSQVYERQLIEEAERSNRLRMEQNAEKQKAKVLVEESPDMPNNGEAEVDRTEPREQEKESLDQEPVRPVTISLDPRSPTNVPSQPPHLVLPQSFSTPRTRRTTENAHYIVTPTRVIKRTPVITPSRKSLTPSSMAGEDDLDEEYTYVEETFNPTESQQSFLNRILQGNNSQLG